MRKNIIHLQTLPNPNPLFQQTTNLRLLLNEKFLVKIANHLAIEENQQVRIQMGTIHDKVQTRHSE